MVLPDQPIALTRRPVKDKGALMQTLHLRLRDLRAIFLRLRPIRWPTPSMLRASTWETASPLSNPLGPTLAVGAPSVRLRNSPGESFQNAASPSHQRLNRYPTLGAGLAMVLTFLETSRCGAVAPARGQVCWSQTALNNPYPAQPHGGRQGMDCSMLARASEVRCTPSDVLSFSTRPQRCHRAPRSGARSRWKKTAGLIANVETLAGASSGALHRRLRHGRG